MAKGREKVDQYAHASIGEFGYLLPSDFAMRAADVRAKQAVAKVLRKFSFPTLNVVFSAAGRLRRRDNNDLGVETRLEEMEVRVTLVPRDADGVEIELDPEAPFNAVHLLGLEPHTTTTDEPEESPFQVQPDVSAILGAIPGIPSTLTAIVSGLGLAFGPLLRRRAPILQKASIAGPSASDNNETGRLEFAWYRRSSEQASQEGPHHGVAFLQVDRDRVAQIDVTVVLASDWQEGRVDNQLTAVTIPIKIEHPAPPSTPDFVNFANDKAIPVVIPGDEVLGLLGVDKEGLVALIDAGRLDAFGDLTADATAIRVTKGSLLALLKLD